MIKALAPADDRESIEDTDSAGASGRRADGRLRRRWRGVVRIVVQIIVITTYWSRDAFSLLLNLTSATTLIPYLFVAAYGLMIAQRGETYDQRPQERQRDLILASLATLYTLFMIYAGGLKFILLSAVLFSPGTLLYFWARREQGKPVFNKPSDWVVFGIIVAGAIYGIYGLATGSISI